MSGFHSIASVPQPPAKTSSKTTGLSHERTKSVGAEKKERRRKQVLRAQRAYRARNEANTTALKQRVAHLESALERMGKAIVQFSDILAEEQILTSHPQVADRLRETLKTCLDSAKYGNERDDDVRNSQLNDTSIGIKRLVNNQSSAKIDTRNSPLPVNSTWRRVNSHDPFLPFELGSAASVIEPLIFVDHLRITCLYQGFLMLNNPSIPLDALRRPFRLFLSLVKREIIASFFYTCLHDRLNNRQPERFNEIPFFELGGTGTHYRGALVSIQNKAWLEEQHFPEVHSALSAVPPEDQEELDGEWFDLWDLAGYLRTERINLSTAPPIEEITHRTVNVVDFTAALVEKGIFLGYSPGFKRSDVETAITLSTWT